MKEGKIFRMLVLFAFVWFCLSVLVGCGPTKPPIVDPPVPVLFDLTVSVYEGAVANDHKAVGASVTVDDVLTLSTDGAGNATFVNLLAGVHTACVTRHEGYVVPQCGTIVIPPGNTLAIELNKVPIPPLKQRIGVGRVFTPRLKFASELYALSKPSDQRKARLAEMKALGFNGVRVFAGELGQVGQTPDSAIQNLPFFLSEAVEEGLYVQVAALTGTATGFNVPQHLGSIGAICAAFVNCLMEIANEPYHPSQSDLLHNPNQLLALTRAVLAGNGLTGQLPFALGAAVQDEPSPDGTYPYDGGEWNTAHLDRGRDKWNMIRRLREIYAIGETTKKAVMSGEPIGAAEVTIPGRREADPNIFFTMGVLCRGFDLGCVFHSEDGLNANPLGPNQTTCAESFIEGFRTFGNEDHYEFKNAGWADSPVAGADFDNGIVRAYSFVKGNQGFTVLVGVKGDPKLVFKNGWRSLGPEAEGVGVTVLRIVR